MNNVISLCEMIARGELNTEFTKPKPNKHPGSNKAIKITVKEVYFICPHCGDANTDQTEIRGIRDKITKKDLIALHKRAYKDGKCEMCDGIVNL